MSTAIATGSGSGGDAKSSKPVVVASPEVVVVVAGTVFSSYDAALLYDHPFLSAAAAAAAATKSKPPPPAQKSVETGTPLHLSMNERCEWQSEVRARYPATPHASPTFVPDVPTLVTTTGTGTGTDDPPNSSHIAGAAVASVSATSATGKEAAVFHTSRRVPMVTVTESLSAYETMIRPFLSRQPLLRGVEQLMDGTAHEFFRTASDGHSLYQIFDLNPPTSTATGTGSTTTAITTTTTTTKPVVRDCGALCLHLNARYCSTALDWTKLALLERGFAFVAWWVHPEWHTAEWIETCSKLAASEDGRGACLVPYDVDSKRVLGHSRVKPSSPPYLNTFRDCTTHTHLQLLQSAYDQLVWYFIDTYGLDARTDPLLAITTHYPVYFDCATLHIHVKYRTPEKATRRGQYHDLRDVISKLANRLGVAVPVSSLSPPPPPQKQQPPTKISDSKTSADHSLPVLPPPATGSDAFLPSPHPTATAGTTTTSGASTGGGGSECWQWSSALDEAIWYPLSAPLTRTAKFQYRIG